MKRPCLFLSWCILVGCAGLAAGSAEAKPEWSPVSKATAHRSRLVPARYFVDPANRQSGVQAVRQHTEPGVTLAGHYSRSIIACGTGCVSYWIVDRRTGAIMDLPRGARDAEYVYDVRGRRDSEVVRVIYGSNPTYDTDALCKARSFRLRGTRFTPIGGFSRARCPG